MICMVNKPIHQLAVENEAIPFNAVKQWHALSVMFQRFENLIFFWLWFGYVVFIYMYMMCVCIFICIYVYLLYIGSLDSIGISEYMPYSFA